MAKETMGVKVFNAALEERGNGDIILRGTIAIESLKNLKTDDYQREVLSRSGSGGRRSSRLAKGIAAGVTLPDIELGMRGQNFSSYGKTITLNDPVYIIDGLQRVSALLDHMEEGEEATLTNPLGATIHFKTTKQWEKERFAALNQLRTPVSPNVLLRNMRDQHPAILTLFGLSRSDPSFALYERVCWDQRMKQREIVTAAAMVRAALGLHRHVTESLIGLATRANSKGGTVQSDRFSTSGAGALDRIAKEIALQNFRENIKDLFELMDDCWGIRSIEYGEAQGHLRGNFISVLSGFLSRNEQLWDGEKQRKLRIDSKTKARLKTFPVNDPEIRRLSAGGTMVIPTLYRYLLDHMNHRRSKNRFK